MPTLWECMDKAHPQTALGTIPQSRLNLSLPVSILWVSLSGQATGGAVYPSYWPAVLNSRLLIKNTNSHSANTGHGVASASCCTSAREEKNAAGVGESLARSGSAPEVRAGSA